MQPQKFGQFVDIIIAFGVLHKEDYVHSDIRKGNLIFGANGRAWIIDFDFANREGTCYPTGYNSLVKEQHFQTQQDRKRKKEHDRYSLSVFMTNFIRTKNLQQYSDFVRKISDLECDLTKIADEIEAALKVTTRTTHMLCQVVHHKNKDVYDYSI